ncbi:MAG: oligosaccharide flippase family protein [Deltaproteobacteria bacterium]|jgi:O-antigen/teichoic acid export membrane protein|nr:oligosaccharide flippase family protein [Deltaproteobacteria bacterium]
MKLKKEMGIATIANWSTTVVMYIIAFFSTPYIVHTFGNVQYGIWSLAMSLTASFGMIELGVSTTLIKYFSDYSEKKDTTSANALLSTGFFTYIVLFFVLLMIMLIVIWKVEYLFNIPDHLIRETKILFLLVTVAFGLNLLGNTFLAVIMSLRKFVIKNQIIIGISIVRVLGIVFVLYAGFGLIVAGVVVLLIDILRNIIFFIYALKLFPSTHISLKLINLPFFKNFFSFTFFNFLRKIAVKMLERADLILVGIFFDMQTVAIYSIAESLVRYARMFPNGILNIILPFSSKLNAQQQKKDLMKIAFFIPKYTISFFLGIIFLFIFFGTQFIELWLGNGYEQAYLITIVLLIAKAIYMSQSVIVHLLVGMGYNKFFGIIGIVEALLKIIISIIFLKIFGVLGIAYGSLVVFFIITMIIIPYYVMDIIGINKFKYYTEAIFIPMLLCFILYFCNSFIEIRSFLWIPVLVLEYCLLFYLFVWKEVRFKNKKLVFDFSF